MTTARYALTGFLLGIVWGVVGRLWMRLISTDPAFSWQGTLLLVGVASLAGAVLGVIGAARRRCGSGWWRLLYVVVPVLFAGAGLPLLPAVVLGGWGLRRGPIGRLVAAVALLSAPVILIVITWDQVTGWLMPYPDNVYRAILGGGGLVLAGAAAWGSTTALAPWPNRRVTTTPPASVAAVAS